MILPDFKKLRSLGLKDYNISKKIKNINKSNIKKYSKNNKKNVLIILLILFIILIISYYKLKFKLYKKKNN